MNYDVHDVEDILNLNNKINSGNDDLFNSNINNQEIHLNNYNNKDLTNKNILKKQEEDELNTNNNLSEYQCDKEIENEKKEENEIEEDDDEDKREIYKMFEDKLYQNESIANNIKPQKINKDKDKSIPISIKNQQSRLMNKYFGNALNNNTNSNNIGIRAKKNNKQKINQNENEFLEVEKGPDDSINKAIKKIKNEIHSLLEEKDYKKFIDLYSKTKNKDNLYVDIEKNILTNYTKIKQEKLSELYFKLISLDK